ncbi:MFS transporter [Chloroflexota bacterium]
MKTICSKKDLWLIRLYYFVLFGALGYILPFLNLYYDRLGISAGHIGIFVTVNSVVSLIVSPMVGLMIGMFPKPVRIIQIELILSGIVLALIGLNESVPILALLVGLNALLFAGVYPTSISIAQSIAEHAPGKVGFGSIRLFGSLGWAIVTYGAGLAIEKYGMVVVFIGYGVFVLVGAWLLGCIKFTEEIGMGESESKGMKLTSVLSAVVKDKALVGFGLMVLISYGALIGVRQFEVLFMDQLGAPESIIGLAFTIAALVEIPFMILSDRLIDKINSTNVLRLSLLLELARLIFVALFPSVPIILIGRAITGIAYALNIVALVKFIHERAPRGQNVTLQALYNITIPNMISILASPVIGSVFDARSGYAMYYIGIIGLIAATIVFLITVRGKRSRVGASV